MTPPTKTLPANAPDDVINALVAEHVAGWRDIRPNPFSPSLLLAGFNDQQGKTEAANTGSPWGIPNYATSADAVLPLLQEHNFEVQKGRIQAYCVYLLEGSVRGGIIGKAPNFPRAACYALLAAHGFTIANQPAT